MHLDPEELVDIAEGTRAESSARHLASCEACRAQLHELRAMMAAVQDADVPEPSPLFWDHLSARISEAVAEEPGAPGIGGFRIVQWMLQGGLAVAAALVLAFVIARHPSAPPAHSPSAAATEAAVVPDQLDDPASDDSLALVAALTGDLDIDTAREAGLATRGSAEHAVTHMNQGELRELRRLLDEEMRMARSGA